MTDQPFVHLHVHTVYSLLDGLSRINKLVERAKALDMPALAITDHGTMFGVIDFYRAAKKEGIKPILGVEGYLAPRRMTDRDSKLDRSPFHMLMLAQNNTGYKNLLKIASAAQLEGFYGKPRIDREFLAAHNEGIIVTSGCLAAQVPQSVMQGNERLAREQIDWYKSVFGRERFFLELQQHDIPELGPVNEWLIDIAKKDDLRLVATNDVHYVMEDDYDPHDTLLCIQTGALKHEQNRMRMTDNSYYLADQAKMWEHFGHVDGGSPLLNTLEVVEMCMVNLDDKTYHLPNFPVPNGYDAESYLRYLCEKGLQWRYGERAHEAQYRERLTFELNVVHKMGFDTYFLIVWDLCEFARAADIWWNVRGSGAGSVAAYCLGITNIDPVENNLLFERFLNPGRVSMPDIDMDFPDDRRSDMIAYTVRKYGEDKVAAIITFGTLGAKAAVRDVGRALGVDLERVNQAARLIPTEPKPKKVHEYVDDNPELKAMYDKDSQIKEVIDVAAHLQGVSRHASTHAAGVIISDLPLVEYLPLHRQTKGGDDDAIGLKLVTQFPMETCESIGLLKVDFLGLSTLTLMRRASDLILKHHGVLYTMDTTPYRPSGDPKQDRMLEQAFELISRGETIGVFQFESTGMQQMLREMRPSKFEHIIAAVSLYRPGPMDFIPKYNARMHGEEEVTFHHPRLEPILAETYSIMVYQEQLMQIASAMFGYPLGEADLMRRAVSKKKKEDLMKHKAIFIERGPKIDPTITPEIAETIFDEIEFFANYGFNKCVLGSTEIVDADTGRVVTVGDLHEKRVQVTHTPTLNTDTIKIERGEITEVMANGVKPVYRLTTQLGHEIEATANHPFCTPRGWLNLGDLHVSDAIAVPHYLPVEGNVEWSAETFATLPDYNDLGDLDELPAEIFTLDNRFLSILFRSWLFEMMQDVQEATIFDTFDNVDYAFALGTKRVARQLQHLVLRLGIVTEIVELGQGKVIFSLKEVLEQDTLGHVYWDCVTSIEYIGEQETYDLTVAGTHNFIANDIIVHNSHAADYAVLAVQTAFMKAHFPHEYMAALLSVYYDDPVKVVTLLSECKRMNIPLLSPDVNGSESDFDIQVDGKTGQRGIRFGLAGVKNVGLGAVEVILKARREGGAFRNLDDFCKRVDLRAVGKKALECLIKVGALESLNSGTRPQLLNALERIASHSTELHKAAERGQMGLFGEAAAESSSDLIGNLPAAAEASPRNMLDWERELLGIFVSSHPIDPIVSMMRDSNLATTNVLKEAQPDMNNRPVRIVGLVAGLRKMPTRQKEMMAVAKLEDRMGNIDAVFFPRKWAALQEFVTDGRVIVVGGKLDLTRGDPQIIVENVTTQFEATYQDDAANTGMDYVPPAYLNDMPEPPPYVPDEREAAYTPAPDYPPVPARANGAASGAHSNGHSNGHANGQSNSNGNGHAPAAYGAGQITQSSDLDMTHAGDSTVGDDFSADWDARPEAAYVPKQIIVRFHTNGDEERDRRRLKRVVQTFIQNPGLDQFEVWIVREGKPTHRLEFKERIAWAGRLQDELAGIQGIECFPRAEE